MLVEGWKNCDRCKGVNGVPVPKPDKDATAVACQKCGVIYEIMEDGSMIQTPGVAPVGA